MHAFVCVHVLVESIYTECHHLHNQLQLEVCSELWDHLLCCPSRNIQSLFLTQISLIHLVLHYETRCGALI